MNELRLSLGNRSIIVRRDLISPHEAGLVLRCSARAVRRRLESGALPVVWVGQRQKIAVHVLIEAAAHDPLALEAAIALAEDRLRLPGPGSSQPTLIAAVVTAALQPSGHASAVVSDPAIRAANSGQIMQVECSTNDVMSDHSLGRAA